MHWASDGGSTFARTYYETVAPGLPLTQKISSLASYLWNTTKFEQLLCDAVNGAVDPERGRGIPMIEHWNQTCHAVQYPQQDGYYH